MGEQAAKSMITGVMNMFGMGGKKEESNVEAGAASSITNAEAKAQIEKENQGIEVTGMTFGGSELISAAKNDREMVGENISSLEEPAPNLITLPIGGAQPAGSAEQGSAESSSSPTGDSMDIGSFAIFKTLLTLSSGISICSANSSGVASLPFSCNNFL